MSGKQITELDSADNLEDGDLILIRKSSMGVDRSLSKAKLIEDIGNAAIQGYTAGSEVENKISLLSSNGAAIPKYYEGMKISFISPIKTTKVVQVKIGTLSYIDLQKYSLDETVTLLENEYVEAVYIDGIFKQTNNLNTHLVWSNEYTAEVDINKEETITIYNLTSAIGVKKPKYYTGMSLLFTAPKTSKGVVFVNVDGLGNKQLGENSDSSIAKDVYELQAIMAIYDGKKFVKQKFSSIHREPIIPEEITEDIEPVIIPDDIYAPDYTGDPDDPANTTSPNALDSKGQPIFKQTVTVGNKAMYKTLPEAVTALVTDYGDDGGGHLFAIEIDTDYAPDELFMCFQGRLKNADLRWITIFAKNNTTINFNKTILRPTCRYTPIFNCKMSFDRRKKSSMTWHMAFYLANVDTTVTFGKNTVINFHATKQETSIIWRSENCSIEAKYGITVQTNCRLGSSENVLINKGRFEYICSAYGYTGLLTISAGVLKMYNSIIYTDITGDHNGSSTILNICNSSKAYLRNVNCKERTGKVIGLTANQSIVTMEECDFTSYTSGSLNSGYDIVVNTGAEIHLKNTTGNRNQPLNKKTSKGIIYND